MIYSFQSNKNAELIDKLESQKEEFVSAELFKDVESGHLFKPGEKARLTGLVDYPQFNGEIITITLVRKDGEYGRAYYFSTENDALANEMNWIYEYRLEKV